MARALTRLRSGLNVLLRARTRSSVRIQGGPPILLHVLTLTETRDLIYLGRHDTST